MGELPGDVEDLLKLLLGRRDLQGLGDMALLDLTRDAQIKSLEKGGTLKADKINGRHLYLIEGEVELVAQGKSMHCVKADTERAQLPLFRVRTPGLAARCISKARLLSLNEKTLEQYIENIKPRETSGISVQEYISRDSQPGLIDEIRDAFYRQEITLPSMPDVATRISRAIHSEDADLRSIATTVQADPVISARLVRVANSAMYSGVSQVESVQTAITRIGLQATRAIVMSVVLNKLFKPQSSIIRKRIKKFYQHSIQTGAISHALASHLQGFDPEQAFLAGLIHDIGVLPVLIQADSQASLSQDSELLERTLDELRAEVGASLLQQWEFEDEFIRAARDAENWTREVDTPDYCDIVQIAQLQSAVAGGQKITASLPMNELPAFRRLGLADIDPVGIIQNARTEINEIMSLLAG